MYSYVIITNNSSYNSGSIYSPTNSLTVRELTSGTSYTFYINPYNSIGLQGIQRSLDVTTVPINTTITIVNDTDATSNIRNNIVSNETPSVTYKKVVSFTAGTSTFTVDNRVTAKILIVGGGGGGGGAYNSVEGGGGGGGGSVGIGTIELIPTITYTVTIANSCNPSEYNNLVTGNNTSISWTNVSSYTETANGGGSGGVGRNNSSMSKGGNGGSGGGGCGNNYTTSPNYGPKGSVSQLDSTTGLITYYGNEGGDGYHLKGGGGGGGAGSSGTSTTSSSNNTGGTGGSGKTWIIDNTTYGVGGNGGNAQTNNVSDYTGSADPNRGLGGNGIAGKYGENRRGQGGGSGILILAFN